MPNTIGTLHTTYCSVQTNIRLAIYGMYNHISGYTILIDIILKSIYYVTLLPSHITNNITIQANLVGIRFRLRNASF